MKKTALLLAAGIALAGCSNMNEHAGHTSSSSEKLEPLKVKLTVPAIAATGEKVSLKAAVTYGKEKVDDADEVMYEIIKDGNSKKSVKKMVERSKDGVYSLDYTFKQAGKYTVISHVTAKNQHTMPQKEITVQ